ncbi:unnamed protein product, partial [Allacma fusca]
MEKPTCRHYSPGATSTFCPKVFSQPLSLELHIREQTTERPHQGILFKKDFYEDQGWKKHKKTHGIDYSKKGNNNYIKHWNRIEERGGGIYRCQLDSPAFSKRHQRRKHSSLPFKMYSILLENLQEAFNKDPAFGPSKGKLLYGLAI